MATPRRTLTPANPQAGSPKTTAQTPAGRAPSADSIAARAYEIWRASGGKHGNDQAHWFQAEQELRARTTPR